MNHDGIIIILKQDFKNRYPILLAPGPNEIELANELGLDIKDHEIIRTNSSGLVIYNPKNLAERIKGMKNTEKTREQKIAERVAYMQQQQNNSDNLN